MKPVKVYHSLENKFKTLMAKYHVYLLKFSFVNKTVPIMFYCVALAISGMANLCCTAGQKMTVFLNLR